MFDDELDTMFDDTSFDDVNFDDLEDSDVDDVSESVDPDLDFDIEAFERELGLDDLILEDADGADDDSLTEAAEASIFMDTLRETFDSDAEFVQYVQENAVEWELYGLIPSASRAIEATKTLKIDDWKAKNRQRLIRRECIRIACKKDDPLYAKYKKYRDLMRQFRQKIFDKYETKAKSNVLKARNNSSAKAANITTSSGKDLKKRVDTSKIDTGKDLKKRVDASKQTSEKGKNPTHAPNKSKAN